MWHCWQDKFKSEHTEHILFYFLVFLLTHGNACQTTQGITNKAGISIISIKNNRLAYEITVDVYF